VPRSQCAPVGPIRVIEVIYVYNKMLNNLGYQNKSIRAAFVTGNLLAIGNPVHFLNSTNNLWRQVVLTSTVLLWISAFEEKPF